MIVVDTSALIAILRSEPEADAFTRTIVDSNEARIGSPTVFEYLMVANGTRANRPDQRIEGVLWLPKMVQVEWTPAHARSAAEAFARYGKGRHPAGLNFGDCMSYALAKSLDAPLLYKGEDFARTDIRSAA